MKNIKKKKKICQLLKRTYFKECILMATFTIYFYKVYSFWIQWFVLCVIDFIETEFLKFYFIKDYFSETVFERLKMLLRAYNLLLMK